MNNRPASGRNVPGTVPHSLPRQAASRTHAHSLSIGSLASANRIDRRRKSSSANTSVATAVRLGLLAEQHKNDASALSIKNARRSVTKSGSTAAFATSLPASSGFEQSAADLGAGSAIVDGAALEPLIENTPDLKSRNRRASDGSRLPKASEGKRQANGELKCETCGKSYKHSSCLHKHLWEHTPEWAITSKLLISKHQQVQLLEAASVLMQITQDAVESDVSSPDASNSELQSDAVSSKDDSPPPRGADNEDETVIARPGQKRYSGNSSTYSQSYQSSVFSEARHLNAHSRQISSDNRPNTAGTSAASYSDEDKEEMSAAFNLLSCSYGGTPVTGPVINSENIPPVPPLPSKYLGKSLDHLSGSTITGVSHATSSLVRGPQRDDVNMAEDDDMHIGDTTADQQHALDADDAEEEVGMFGRMEE